MTTKLTLSIEKSLIAKAKSYARKSGRSLSEMVENYFRMIADSPQGSNELPEELKKLRGSLQLPRNFDEKKEIRRIMQKKHKA